jgi:hypothetical protein
MNYDGDRRATHIRRWFALRRLRPQSGRRPKSEFWSRSESAADPMDIQIAISKVKPGYYLLVAKKN